MHHTFCGVYVEIERIVLHIMLSDSVRYMYLLTSLQAVYNERKYKHKRLVKHYNVFTTEYMNISLT